MARDRSHNGVRNSFSARPILASLFVTLMLVILAGGILKVINQFVTVIPAYVTVTVDVKSLSAEERQNVRERLEEVGVPEASIEKILSSSNGAMLYVSRRDGARFSDSQLAEFMAQQHIDPPDDTVRGVLVFLKKLQLKGVKFEDAMIRTDSLSRDAPSTGRGK